MAHALVAAYTVVGLAELGHGAVITHEEGTTHVGIALVLTALGDVALVDTLVVVEQYGGYIESVGTRHAILAFDAWNGGEFGNQAGHFVQKGSLVGSERFERR